MAVVINGNGAITGVTSGVGEVLQIQSTILDSVTSFTSSSYADFTALNVSITPSSTSSKIWVGVEMCLANTGSGNYSTARLRRTIGGSGEVTVNGPDKSGYSNALGGLYGVYDYNSWYFSSSKICSSFFDAPNTTSECNYKVQILNYAASTSGSARVGANGYYSNRDSVADVFLNTIIYAWEVRSA